jgi:ABC-type multidrug transport system ATPase subunit
MGIFFISHQKEDIVFFADEVVYISNQKFLKRISKKEFMEENCIFYGSFNELKDKIKEKNQKFYVKCEKSS